MLRQNDPVSHHVDRSFWEHVEKMDDGCMSCKFCGHCFATGTAMTRIKLHLAGVTGRGVKTCGKVPQDVRDAARAAIDGDDDVDYSRRLISILPPGVSPDSDSESDPPSPPPPRP